MSHKLDLNKNKDPLASLFREKLENHQHPVDGDGWHQIKKQLKGGRKMVLWTVFSAVSAAVVALLFILSPMEKSPVDNPLQGETTKATVKDINDKAIADNVAASSSQHALSSSVDEVSMGKEKSVNDFVAKAERLSSTEDKSKASAEHRVITQEIRHSNNAELVATVDEVNHEKEVEQVKLAQASIDSEVEKDEKKADQQVLRADLFDLGFEEKSEMSKKNNWTLAAAYTGNAVNGSTSDAQAPAIVRSNESSNLLAQSAVQSDFGEWKHSPELSFSLAIGKRISNRLAIESGLTYTYLYSKGEGVKQNKRYQRKQNLHYIGIPVNVTGYLLTGTSKWQIYASAGGMIEKGIRMTYKDEAINDALGGKIDNGGKSISGVQLSVNASVGVSYDLSKELSLFLAPRLSYYFDNDQPESIRTDRDISFGATIGLKFNL